MFSIKAPKTINQHSIGVLLSFQHSFDVCRGRGKRPSPRVSAPSRLRRSGDVFFETRRHLQETSETSPRDGTRWLVFGNETCSTARSLRTSLQTYGERESLRGSSSKCESSRGEKRIDIGRKKRREPTMFRTSQARSILAPQVANKRF